jgi:hypothetical protein
MKKLVVALMLMTASWVAAEAASERTLTESFPAENVDRVHIDVGVGGVEIESHDSDRIEITVLLTARRGGIFSSMKEAELDVEEAELSSEIVGTRFYLDVDSGAGDERYEEQWTVGLPGRLQVELDIGLGDVTAAGLERVLEVEVGVGDVEVHDAAGDLIIEVGVGDVDISGQADRFGDVSASGGVGDAKIKVLGKRISSEGFVGHSATWVGDGPGRIEVEVGVGEAVITLE